jgi:tripartite-type tricarboxylate transporter receptor subunit TctC
MTAIKMIKTIIFSLLVFFLASPVSSKELITIISPSAPGGGTTLHAHLVANMFNEHGWPTVVINRVSSDSIIGANFVAKSTPDGTTLLLGSTSAMSANIAFSVQGMEYDENSFVPISLLNQFGTVLAVPASSEIKNYEQFISYIKKNPEKFNLGSHNISYSTIFNEWAQREGLPKPNIILYKGSLPLVTDLLGGHIPFMWDNYTAPLLPLVESGKVRIIAALDHATVEQLKKIQTNNVVTDLSKKYKDFELINYYGLFAPAGISPNLVAEMNYVINESAKMSKFWPALESMNIKNIGGTPEMLTVLQKNGIYILKKFSKQN